LAVFRGFGKGSKDKEKFVVAVNLMENPKTGTLMSKSNNTGVFLGADSKTLFGQIMAQPDEMIEIILINDTRVPLDEIKALDIPNNPMKAKLFTAREVTRIFYGEAIAEQEYENFVNTFSKKKFSDEAKIVELNRKEISLFDLLCICLSGESKSGVHRLIQQNAVSVNGDKCSNAEDVFSLSSGNDLQLKIGKKQFFLIRFSSSKI
jgi:tyrosyl-tRNA synthetase